MSVVIWIFCRWMMSQFFFVCFTLFYFQFLFWQSDEISVQSIQNCICLEWERRGMGRQRKWPDFHTIITFIVCIMFVHLFCLEMCLISGPISVSCYARFNSRRTVRNSVYSCNWCLAFIHVLSNIFYGQHLKVHIIIDQYTI